MTKGGAFWVSLAAIIALYALTLFKAPEILSSVGGTMILAIAAAGGVFTAGNVADKVAKGKFYRKELDTDRAGKEEGDG
jgi:glucokinase